MTKPLRQSTSYTFRAGPFVDDTDGFTAETALTIIQQDVKISKDGGAFAQTSQTGLFPHDSRGWYQIDLTATDTNTLGPLTVDIFKSGALPVWHDFVVIPTGIYDSMVDGTVNLAVDIYRVYGNTTSASNLKDQYDGSTGLTGDTFPATQLQVNSIGVSTGGALNFANEADNIDSAIKSVSFVGVETTGTNASVNAADGSYHQIDDTGNAIDIVYQFAVGGGRTAVQVLFRGYVAGSNDVITMQAYNGSGWDTIGTIEGQIGTTNISREFVLLSTHTGTGADLGKVFIRLVCSGQSNPTLYTDQLIVSAVNIGQSVGYSDGSIWIDTQASNTSTESFVDGVADNPVSTWAAAQTLSSAIGIKRFHVAGGSSITLTSSASGYQILGNGLFSLALGGQSIDNAYIKLASISGSGSGNGYIIEDSRVNAGTTTGPGYYVRCGFLGTSGSPWSASSQGEYSFVDCVSLAAAAAQPYFYFGNTGGTSYFNVRRWGGGFNVTGDSNTNASIEVTNGGTCSVTSGGGNFEVRGLCKALALNVSASENIQFVGVAGHVTLAGAATSATVGIHGIVTDITDTSTGTTLDDGALRADTVVSIVGDTNELQTDWTNGGRLDSLLDLAVANTQGGGSGLVSIPWNATWDAEVQSEVQDAIEVNKLDHLVAVADADDPIDNSIIAKLASSTADWSTFVSSTDSLEAIRNRGDVAWVGSGGGVTETGIRYEIDQNSTQLASIISSIALLATEEMLTAVSGDVRTLASDWANGGRLDNLLDNSIVNTQGGGSGLTNIPWNATWDAEVQSEVQDAIEVNKLDHLVAVADADDAVNDSIVAKLASKTADWSTFISGDDSLEAIRDRGDVAWVGSGGGVTESGIRYEIDQNSTQLASIISSIAALNDLGSGDVNTQVLYGLNEYDALKTTTFNSSIANVATSEMLTAVSGDVRTLAADWANGGRLDNLLDNSITNTQGGGSGLTSIPWNAAWDAEVESEATDALNAFGFNNLASGDVNTQVIYALNEYGALTTSTFNSSVANLATASMLTAMSGDLTTLKGDWDNGGRLDIILDELTTQGDANETKLNSIITNTQMGGSGFDSIPWNPSWDAEVQSEVTDGLNAFNFNNLASGDINTQVLYALNEYGSLKTSTFNTTAATLATSSMLSAMSGDLTTLKGDWDNGGRLDNILDELTTQGDTNEGKLNSVITNTQLGGSGLDNIPWNAVWDAEVQSEVTDALNVYGFNNLASGDINTQVLYGLNQYDPPTRTELTTDVNSIISSVNQIWTSAIAESYRSTGASGTAGQILYEILGNLINQSNSGVIRTVTMLDKSTTAKTYTYDSTTPTSIEETT